MRRLERRMNMEENHFLAQKARSNNLNPPVDLRLLDYESAYDDNLVCPICRCPFIDPVVLEACDHCFCRDCIRQTWSTYTPLGPKGDCPVCRTPGKLGPRSATSKILINIVDELKVKCPKSDDGCSALIKRGEVQDHVSIYCGYAMVECTRDECELPIRRKDLLQGCQHFGVSCLDCHQAMMKADLESHWKSDCPDRIVHCELCKSSVFYREWEQHRKQTCLAMSIPCPGRSFGCMHRSKKPEAETHAKRCTLAKLAPFLASQQQRMDEQEAAQKQMTRKLEVLENGFAAMQGILYPKQDDPDNTNADESRIPLLDNHSRHESNATIDSAGPGSPSDFHFPAPPTSRPASTLPLPSTANSELISTELLGVQGFRSAEAQGSLSDDFGYSASLPPPAANGPYASPLHHLLSMHENLRDEMSRVSSALSELDGRHSMQILNENLRTREEIAYLGGQVAGMNRQLHWLTSAQLQKQQGHGSASGSSSAVASNSDIAGAGAGVEAAVNAVNTAATALRGAARVVNVGRESMGMRRGPSEEGRTKL